MNWNTSVNFSLQRNELKSFPNFEQSVYRNILVIGEPITINKVFNFHGVDPNTGSYGYSDSAGTQTIALLLFGIRQY